MAESNIYTQVNSMEDVFFIGGNPFTFDFTVYDSENTLVNLTGATVLATLARYGSPDYALVTETGTVTGMGTFSVTLTTDDTKYLSGKFVIQPVVIDFKGTENRPAQGIVTIIPRIQNS